LRCKTRFWGHDGVFLGQKRTKTPIRKNPIPAKLAGQIYLDPTYDPAFKALFGDENALKDFLDGVLNLEGDDRIKTLRFRFDEPLVFHVPQEKKVILDIFATTGSGRFLNIEMQRWEKDFFIDRAILYKAFLVIKGRKEIAEARAEAQAKAKAEEQARAEFERNQDRADTLAILRKMGLSEKKITEACAELDALQKKRRRQA